MRQIFRIFIILKTIKAYNLEEGAYLPIRLFIRILFFFQPKNAKTRKMGYGQRLALALESLGPVFIKFGQLLSIRSDLVGEVISKDLMKLQDNCSFVDFAQIKKTIEAEFEQPLAEIFTSFEEKPIASASIAQVHFALLEDGTEVAVKVVKADIKQKIQSDIFILKFLSTVFDWLNGKRGIKLKNLIKQFEELIFREMDMRMEAANASLMERNLEFLQWVHIPKIHFKYLREKVLVMGRVNGVSINDIEKIEKLKIDKELLAHRGLELVLRQIFKHNFFHADLHPGNILISANGHLHLVDFGLVGSLNAADKIYLAENYAAFFKHDYARVVENHIQSGWVPKDTNVLDFQAHLRMVIEPLSQKSLNEISMAKLLMTLFIVARKFNMTIPHELALVDKTMLQIESMGRKLNPNLNVWKVMEPLIEEFVMEQRKPFQSLDDLKIKLGHSIQSLLEIHPQLERFLENQNSAPKPKAASAAKRVIYSSLVGALVGAGLFSLLNHW